MAEWTTAFVNDLPDSSFALILPGGEKDEDGKTTPRSLRKLPYKDGDGAVDVPHLRNALARIGQVEGASADEIAAAKAKLEKAADEHLKTRQEETVEMDYKQALEFFNAAVENLTALGELLVKSADEEMPDAEPEEEPSDDTAGDTEEPEESETSELSELAMPIISLLEQDAPTNRRAPLSMEVSIIKVGPGNERDNHYYTREMLERDGKSAFEGLTMHVVDHKEDQRSEQTDVSTIKEVFGVRDMQDGAYLVSNVMAYDPGFCEKVRNRADAGELDKLRCSIIGKGTSTVGEIDGVEYNIVQSISEGRFVDWVTRDGAGGHAMALSESDAEPEPEPEPEDMEPPADVQEVDIEEAGKPPPQISMHEALNALSKTNLPAGSLVQLAEGTYENTAALETAITAEIDRLKASGSGQPFANPTQQQPSRRHSRADIIEAQTAVNSKWLK